MAEKQQAEEPNDREMQARAEQLPAARKTSNDSLPVSGLRAFGVRQESIGDEALSSYR